MMMRERAFDESLGILCVNMAIWWQQYSHFCPDLRRVEDEGTLHQPGPMQADAKVPDEVII